MTVKLDAAKILSDYLEVLKKPNQPLVRDVTELPYPKEAIRGILQYCIKLAGSGEEREFLRNAYLCLADFQPLSAEEKTLVTSWTTASGGAQAPMRQQMASAAKSLAAGGKVATGLTERIKAEAAGLVEELQLAGL